MLRLMNSAMMPKDGHYHKRMIGIEEFKEIFNEHSENYMYHNACRVVSCILGCEIELSREETTLRHGDIMLVAKLKHRINPNEKSQNVHGNNIEDYEFSVIFFEEYE